MENVIASVLEQSIIAGAFIYMLYTQTSRNDNTLIKITESMGEMSGTMHRVCNTMGDISDTMSNMNARMEHMERRIERIEERR